MSFLDEFGFAKRLVKIFLKDWERRVGDFEYDKDYGVPTFYGILGDYNSFDEKLYTDELSSVGKGQGLYTLRVDLKTKLEIGDMLTIGSGEYKVIYIYSPIKIKGIDDHIIAIIEKHPWRYKKDYAPYPLMTNPQMLDYYFKDPLWWEKL